MLVWRKIGFILILVCLSACGPVNQKKVGVSDTSQTVDTTPPTNTSISIDSGAASTTSTSVTLTLEATEATEMYVTNTPGCGSGGTWEGFSTSRAWTLGQTNGVATVYSKFRDLALNESPCINDTISHINPPGGIWTSTSTNIPSSLTIVYSHAGVWTGSKLIVWGINANEPAETTGGTYDPITQEWTLISLTNSPQGRYGLCSVWTGTEMFVWGGYPAINGGLYNPETNSWRSVATSGQPSGYEYPGCVWTGTEIIVWVRGTGKRYNPTTNTWSSINLSNAPTEDLIAPSIVWTGSEMIVWGGQRSVSGPPPAFPQLGGIYNPQTDSWRSTTATNAPTGRALHRAVWTGTKMLIWGGGTNSGPVTSGSLYDPATDSWTDISTINAPQGQRRFSMVWTGDKAIIWGGESSGSGTDQGGVYDPLTDSWTETSLINAPSARFNHTGVWTGTEMIIWGGQPPMDQSGGVYSP